MTEGYLINEEGFLESKIDVFNIDSNNNSDSFFLEEIQDFDYFTASNPPIKEFPSKFPYRRGWRFRFGRKGGLMGQVQLKSGKSLLKRRVGSDQTRYHWTLSVETYFRKAGKWVPAYMKSICLQMRAGEGNIYEPLHPYCSNNRWNSKLRWVVDDGPNFVQGGLQIITPDGEVVNINGDVLRISI